MSSMMPPDLSQMISGGAPGAAPAGGGMPPDLSQLMGGGAAPPAPGDQTGASITDGQHGGGQDALVNAINSLQDAIDNEADQEDIQVMLQCQAKLQAILAKDQKAADSAMGGNLPPAAARKMAGGLGA